MDAYRSSSFSSHSTILRMTGQGSKVSSGPWTTLKPSALGWACGGTVKHMLKCLEFWPVCVCVTYVPFSRRLPPRCLSVLKEQNQHICASGPLGTRVMLQVEHAVFGAHVRAEPLNQPPPETGQWARWADTTR